MTELVSMSIYLIAYENQLFFKLHASAYGSLPPFGSKPRTLPRVCARQDVAAAVLLRRVAYLDPTHTHRALDGPGHGDTICH